MDTAVNASWKPTEEVPILVSGAGPAGLITSVMLSRYGIWNLVVEKRERLSMLPRARHSHQDRGDPRPVRAARRRGSDLSSASGSAATAAGEASGGSGNGTPIDYSQRIPCLGPLAGAGGG